MNENGNVEGALTLLLFGCDIPRNMEFENTFSRGWVMVAERGSTPWAVMTKEQKVHKRPFCSEPSASTVASSKGSY